MQRVSRIRLTGRSYPVAHGKRVRQLERGVSGSRQTEPGAPLMASFEGDITHRSAIDGVP